MNYYLFSNWPNESFKYIWLEWMPFEHLDSRCGYVILFTLAVRVFKEILKRKRQTTETLDFYHRLFQTGLIGSLWHVEKMWAALGLCPLSAEAQAAVPGVAGSDRL